jgi:hypothetical protein
MTSAEVVETLRREYDRLMGAIESVGPDAVVSPEGWTAKDVLAHCIHWAAQPAKGMGAALEPPSYVIGVDGPSLSTDEWNARAVAHHKGRSFDEVRAEFDAIVDALIEQASMRTDDEMLATDTLPWAGARPLWNKIGTETFLHWPAHTEQISRSR